MHKAKTVHDNGKYVVVECDSCDRRTWGWYAVDAVNTFVAHAVEEAHKAYMAELAELEKYPRL